LKSLRGKRIPTVTEAFRRARVGSPFGRPERLSVGTDGARGVDAGRAGARRASVGSCGRTRTGGRCFRARSGAFGGRKPFDSTFAGPLETSGSPGGNNGERGVDASRRFEGGVLQRFGGIGSVPCREAARRLFRPVADSDGDRSVSSGSRRAPPSDVPSGEPWGRTG
jgi:hypothetical protein